MNFNQWRKYAKKKDVSKITYICGDQPTLIELTLGDIKNILQVSAADYIELDPSSNFWESASSYPIDPNANRLTIVRHAETITRWRGLAEWVNNTKANPKNYLVFVSAESDAPSVFDKGKRTGYATHIELIRNKGKFIRCSQPNNDDLVSWAMEYGLSNASAEFLVARTAGDVTSMYNVLRKVHIWGASPAPQAIKLLCDESALESLADCIILGDKKQALLALQQLDNIEYTKVLSRLDLCLDYITDINRCLARRMYDVDIASTTGIKIFIVKKYKHAAPKYDFNRIKQCRQLLAVIDSAVRNGNEIGTMEAVISLW